MRKLVGLLLLWASWCGAVENALLPQGIPPLPTLPGVPSAPPAPLHMHGGAFDLRFVNVGQLVDLLYGEALHVPHVISNEVLQDQRLVSFQWDGKRDELHDFVRVFLESQGFKVETRDGVDFIGRRADTTKGTPPAHYVYHAKHRSAAYLVQVLGPLFASRGAVGVLPGALDLSSAGAPDSASSTAGMLPASNDRAATTRVPSVTAAEQLVASGDEVVFFGSADDVAQLKAILPELDVSPGELVVRGWVYEVTENDSKSSAFSIAVNVLGGALSISNGDTTADRNSLRFAGPHIDAAITALNGTTNFRQISNPHVRVQSGQHVRLNVGAQVPTLGSVSYQGTSGAPVQSVTYQDAGLIFDVLPSIVGDSIDMAVDEQLSDFVATTTGVAGSPTKHTREMKTSMRMADGEVVVIGGLTQDTASDARNRFPWLPSFLDGKGASKGRTEIVLVLQVQKV
ncbi:type II secretion system protein GspD [Trinickia fusca]|uniref:Type II secretory pathway protein n=1 Tax=Trinickia fusca TaxID=2419777 RepID=A0A494XEE7_9BURK|nr:type II secretory pathway protein [Trinickia fusca]RKP46856.1 type II secretory pathway protein [Trinickia fusca]